MRRPTQASTPVLIVGAGPVGMTLANLLGSQGIACVVLERERALFDRPRAVGTDFDCMRAWQAVGLASAMLPDMVACGRDGLGLVYHDPDGRVFLEVRPERRRYGFAMAYGFIQPLVDRVLLAGLERFEQIDLRFGRTVERISEEADGVRVWCRDASGRTSEIQAGYVVGCDGGGSVVRQKLGIAMQGSRRASRWLVVDALEQEGQGRDSRAAAIHCDPARPRVCIPRMHGHRRFEFLLHPEEPAEALLEESRLRELLATFGAGDARVLRKVVTVFRGAVAERFGSRRVLLAGDSAHVTPPFAGQGLAIGVRDAFNLAWKLAAVVRGDAGAALLESYDEERRPHARKSVALGVQLGRIMMPRGPIRANVVAGLIRGATKLAGLGPWLREGGPRPDPHYRGRLFVGARPGSLSGWMAIQPEVRTTEGLQPLDSVLGPGFAWLSWEPPARLRPDATRLLESLRARVVRLQPRGVTPRTGHEIEDSEGALAAWLGPDRARCLLIRPDRFVAIDTQHARSGQALRLFTTRAGWSEPAEVGPCASW